MPYKISGGKIVDAETGKPVEVNGAPLDIQDALEPIIESRLARERKARETETGAEIARLKGELESAKGDAGKAAALAVKIETLEASLLTKDQEAASKAAKERKAAETELQKARDAASRAQQRWKAGQVSTAAANAAAKHNFIKPADLERELNQFLVWEPKVDDAGQPLKDSGGDLVEHFVFVMPVQIDGQDGKAKTVEKRLTVEEAAAEIAKHNKHYIRSNATPGGGGVHNGPSGNAPGAWETSKDPKDALEAGYAQARQSR